MYVFSGLRIPIALAKRLHRPNSIDSVKKLTLTSAKELVANAFSYKNWHELKITANQRGAGPAHPIQRSDYDKAISSILDHLGLQSTAAFLVKREFDKFLEIDEIPETNQSNPNIQASF